ncbi:L-threonylcarbamoyladenylate synthase [Deinococcus ruber]|uniref:L-threonylcarbamoyladenylate synthase n=1 Tax=Deinococcus ruber TaxID=1848197 RepID=A0A918C6D1_9DEIO|nr:L-threonylcarbamoyladenylate synthase [Deinococcus ruber]GGR09112.1 SUA5-like protein [Deinococcus ruber]
MNRAGNRHASAETQATVAEALKVLTRGGVVGYPSETVWGLAALPSSAAGVERLYTLKGRDNLKPVQLSCVSAEVAHTWVRSGQPEFERLARLWPGPLTVLAWAVPGCPERLAPGGVVGLRVPAHPLALALLGEAGGTLATTSLNPSGQPAATSRQQAEAYQLAELLLPGDGPEDASGSGQASTVYDLRSGTVLRQGDITLEQLREALR